ncbi:hypothetical protein [[Bacillus] enclensis]|uniref:hypothetical protein n=1 Tax=[Bacillus] enclensis TaxID=1402860 RepID=UPI0018DCF039|nr:hypothetical protein [[Bacillus] enclensis]MBH9966069.1 hypothetical protein [[Bacillus] enclensis]
MRKRIYGLLLIPFAVIGLYLAFTLPPGRKPYVILLPLLFWILYFYLSRKNK